MVKMGDEKKAIIVAVVIGVVAVLLLISVNPSMNFLSSFSLQSELRLGPSGYVVKDNKIFSAERYTAGVTVVLGGTIVNTMYPETVPVVSYPLEGNWKSSGGSTISFLENNTCVMDTVFYTTAIPVKCNPMLLVGGGPTSCFDLSLVASSTYKIMLTGVVLNGGSFDLTGPTKYQPACYGCPTMRATENFVRQDQVNTWGQAYTQSYPNDYWFNLYYKPTGKNWILIDEGKHTSFYPTNLRSVESFKLNDTYVLTNVTLGDGELRADLLVTMFPSAPIPLAEKVTLGNDTAKLDSGIGEIPEKDWAKQQNKTPGFEMLTLVVSVGVALILLKRRKK